MLNLLTNPLVQYAGVFLLLVLICLAIAGLSTLIDGRRSSREQRIYDEQRKYGGL